MEESRLRDALKLKTLIGCYWGLAFVEGQDERTTDTPDGQAERVWSEIERLIDKLADI